MAKCQRGWPPQSCINPSVTELITLKYGYVTAHLPAPGDHQHLGSRVYAVSPAPNTGEVLPSMGNMHFLYHIAPERC